MFHQQCRPHVRTIIRYQCAHRGAAKLGDTELIAKLSERDVVAIEANYHRNCFRAVYDKIRPSASKDEGVDRLHCIAVAEFVVFMDNSHVFILSYLANIY